MIKARLWVNNILEWFDELLHLPDLFRNYWLALFGEAVINTDAIIVVLRFGDQYTFVLQLVEDRVEGAVGKLYLPGSKLFNLSGNFIPVHAAVFLQYLQYYCLQWALDKICGYHSIYIRDLYIIKLEYFILQTQLFYKIFWRSANLFFRRVLAQKKRSEQIHCVSGIIVCALRPKSGLWALWCYLREERLFFSELFELLLLDEVLLLLEGALLRPSLRLLLCDLAAGADDLLETEGDDFCTVPDDLVLEGCDLWAADCDLWAGACEDLWTVDCDLCAEGWDFWAVDCDLCAEGCDLWAADCDLWAGACEDLWTVDCDLWVVDCLVASGEDELLVDDVGALFTASDVLLRTSPFWPDDAAGRDELPVAAGLLLSVPVAAAGRDELPVAAGLLLSVPVAAAGRDLLPAAAGLLLSVPDAPAGRDVLPVAAGLLLSVPDAAAGRAELLRVPRVLA
jgi:hypothetical protein